MLRWRKRRLTSSPSRPGSIQSRMTRSGRSCSARSTALGPSKACTTRCPSSSRWRRSSAFSSRSSSTIRMVATRPRHVLAHASGQGVAKLCPNGKRVSLPERTMTDMPRRRLGTTDIDVSVLSLGSWLTFERLPRETGLEIMRAAQECGISFLDDARHNDPTGTAPLASGYSEVVFDELFRTAGWSRERTVIGNKLWFEFWPEQDAMGEIDGS